MACRLRRCAAAQHQESSHYAATATCQNRGGGMFHELNYSTCCKVPTYQHLGVKHWACALATCVCRVWNRTRVRTRVPYPATAYIGALLLIACLECLRCCCFALLLNTGRRGVCAISSASHCTKWSARELEADAFDSSHAAIPSVRWHASTTRNL